MALVVAAPYRHGVAMVHGTAVFLCRWTDITNRIAYDRTVAAPMRLFIRECQS
jgi:hypothetical protein